MRRLHLLAALAAALLAGCFPDKAFDCGVSDSRCNVGERCIDHHCAVRDSACPSGFQFSATAGSSLAGACVGVLPDGGLPCTQAGDRCDDGDPCTDDDVCVDAMTCKGTPKSCGADSCKDGMLTSAACVNGACMTSTKPCAPYACADATKCGSTCAAFGDCRTGYYCSSNKCLSCADVLSAPNYVPQFSALAPIPGVNLNNIDEEAPFLSDDRKTLWFASNRSGGLGQLDIWVATRAAADLTTPFASPMDLSAMVNGTKNETHPFTLDGMSIYFSSDRSMLDWDLLVGGNIAPAPPTGGPFDTAAREAHPTLTSDLLRLYFDSDRASMSTVGERTPALYFAVRQAATTPFGPVTPVPGSSAYPMNPWYAFYAPAITRDASALYAVDNGVPTRPQIVFAHLDPSGVLASAPAVIPNTLLAPATPPMTVSGSPGAWSSVAVSADGCFLVATSRANDGAGDAVWAYRTGSSYCSNQTCGAVDGCCPSGCNGVYDPDCPMPRTQLVLEYYSPTDANYWYGLVGEMPPNGYSLQNKGFRLFQDALPGSDKVLRESTTGCDGKLYTYVGTEDRTKDPNIPGFAIERTLGYVFKNTVNGTTPLRRILREAKGVGCDMRLSFAAQACSNLPVGYSCGTVENWVQP